MKIEISNLGDIKKISSFMHDAVFSKENIHYDYEQKKFRLDATRFMWERAERKGRLRAIKAPWIRCKLELNGVLECEINEYESLDNYELSSIEIKKDQWLIIYTAVGIEIQLRIKEVKGLLYDIGDAIEKE